MTLARQLFQKHAFIFKTWFFLEMFFHFQNVKGFVIVVWPCFFPLTVFKLSGTQRFVLSIAKHSTVFFNYFSLFQRLVFIFKMGFRMSFHFQNIILFWNVLSFSKCERFWECWFLALLFFLRLSSSSLAPKDLYQV